VFVCVYTNGANHIFTVQSFLTMSRFNRSNVR